MATAKKYKGGMTHTEYSKMYKARNQEKSMYSYAKGRAYKKGLEFNIDPSDIIIPTHCSILGIPIFRLTKEDKPIGPCANSASLDRLDNRKGYIKGNIQVISHKANTMKHNASPEELIRFAKWILNTYEETYDITE